MLSLVFGINTNQEQFPPEISEIASSIKNEFGIDVDGKKVITEFCNLLEKKIKNTRGKLIIKEERMKIQ